MNGKNVLQFADENEPGVKCSQRNALQIADQDMGENAANSERHQGDEHPGKIHASGANDHHPCGYGYRHRPNHNAVVEQQNCAPVPHKLTGESGLTTLELFLHVVPVLFGLLAVIVLLQVLVAQAVVISAAREAARTLAVYHDADLAVQKAAEIFTILPTGGGFGGTATVIAGTPPPPGSSPQLAIGNPAQNPNYTCSFSPCQDVQLYDDGTYCYAVVNYHVNTIAPGLPYLLQGSPFWSRWLNVQGRATFEKEQ